MSSRSPTRAGGSAPRSAARRSATPSPTAGSWRASSRRPIAASSPRCTPNSSGWRSAPVSTSPPGWRGPGKGLARGLQRLTSPRRSRGVRRPGDAAPACVGTAALGRPSVEIACPDGGSQRVPRRRSPACRVRLGRLSVRARRCEARSPRHGRERTPGPRWHSRTSESRKSATAATSSAAVGRPYSELIAGRRPRADPRHPTLFR